MSETEAAIREKIAKEVEEKMPTWIPRAVLIEIAERIRGGGGKKPYDTSAG